MNLTAALRYHTLQLEKVTEAAEARAMATLLLEHVTQIDRQQFHNTSQVVVTSAQQEQLALLTQRIVAGEPLQYVIEEAWFCGLKLSVKRGVLIPRPETEELVEWVIENCQLPESDLQILDLGTGSGCIALALKQKWRRATVTAVDLEEEALKQTSENAVRLGLDVQVLRMDLLHSNSWNALPLVHVIVSNPPYISRQEKETISPRVLEHEPPEALFAPGEDSMIFYRQLALLASEKLFPGGQLFAELNPIFAAETATLFQQRGALVTLKEDMQGKVRMLRALYP